LGQAEKLFSFFERGIIIPLGGFYDLDDEGRQTPPGYGAADKPARYLFAMNWTQLVGPRGVGFKV
jgi:hypothetical protein